MVNNQQLDLNFEYGVQNDGSCSMSPPHGVSLQPSLTFYDTRNIIHERIEQYNRETPLILGQTLLPKEEVWNALRRSDQSAKKLIAYEDTPHKTKDTKN